MKMKPNFKGMRWFKCDLHMHTPADAKHWRGDPMGSDADQAAEAYIRRCYESGLEIIAVTDHNFSSKSFLPSLQRAIDRLSGEFNYRIMLFPGFEISADVGKGMHVLAIFEPETSLEEIDHILTNCGVPMPREKTDGTHQQSTKRLPDIIEEVQKKNQDGYFKGMVICPHPLEIGLFDNGRISEWLQQQEWRNDELFAVEVPKPISQMSSGWQRLFRNGEDCQADWRRTRPIAPIMSSDAKTLLTEEPDVNYIGKRFSWIKMSRPSIESLRQAFLDPDSRICLDVELPRVLHTHIKGISISGTRFLQDQALGLSPHLNCIIGGRGSGKSMFFESLRIGLRGEAPFKDLDDKEHVAVRQTKRLRSTFTNNVAIRLDVFHDDVEDRFVVDHSTTLARIENRDVADPSTVFRRLDTLIFSQEEITQLADRQTSLLDFIDNLNREKIEVHRNRAMEIIETLKSARFAEDKLHRLDSELTVLNQEVEELGRQLSAKTTVQEELKKHRSAQDAKRYVQAIEIKAQETRERLNAIAEALEAEPPPLGSRVDGFPHPAFFQQVEDSVDKAYQALAQQLQIASDLLVKTIADATTEHADWPEVKQLIEKTERDFHKACSDKGLTVEEAEKLRETEQQYRVKKAAWQTQKTEKDKASKGLPDIQRLLEDLTRYWLDETRARQKTLSEVTCSDTMPRTEKGEAIVKPSLTFAGDRDSFLRQWGELSPARNTRVGRLWDRYSRDGSNVNIGDVLFDSFKEYCHTQQDPIAGNPLQWLEINWDNKAVWPAMLLDFKADIAAIRKEKREKWFDLMIRRVPDAADLTLLRSDSSEAGSFQHNDLSSGQKNTAILSLLLARGTGPVMIDQPEDELDSEFLYKELVPLLRKAKKQRQLIVVTHNANIPVNADAELIYALKAEGGRGVCLSQGGLDCPNVSEAVLDIMEGSEEAFRRRQEKYHF